MPAVAEKRCGRCKLLKPLSEFNKNNGKPDGLAWDCKQCRKGDRADRRKADPEEAKRKQRAASARWRARYPERHRAQNKRQQQKKQLAKYGLAVEQYEAMYCEQGGKCASCDDPFDCLYVDHDHETGAVRGLLCKDCNWGIGNFRDDPNKLDKAARYLRRHGLRAVA